MKPATPSMKAATKFDIRRYVSSQHHFWSARRKATDPRIKILDLLKESPDPLTAAQIKEKLPDVHLATIYRTLKILLGAELIRRTHGLNRKETLFDMMPLPGRKTVQ